MSLGDGSRVIKDRQCCVDSCLLAPSDLFNPGELLIEDDYGAHRHQEQRKLYSPLSHLHTHRYTITAEAQKDGHIILKHKKRIVCKSYIGIGIYKKLKSSNHLKSS